MANFGDLKLTALGIALQEKAQTGVELQFTRVAIGDGLLPSGGSLSALTALINQKMSIAINAVTLNNSLATLTITFSNNGLSAGFYIRELGIFATDPDVGEILYAVANAGDTPDYLPAAGSNIVEEIFEIVTTVGSATNVSATIDNSLTYVTLGAFNDHHHVINGQNDGKQINASDVVNIPSGLITATTVQAAINQLKSGGNISFTSSMGLTSSNIQNAIIELVNLTNPIGTILEYAGSTDPTGYLLCYGQAVSRSTYSVLFGIIGTSYGIGDGSTTFNIPDKRGRVGIGLDNIGGTKANRVSNASAIVLGGSGGEENHTLGVTEITSHNHGGATGNQSADHTHSGTTENDSPDHTHNATGAYVSQSTIGGPVFANCPGNAGGSIPVTTGASVRHTHGFTSNGVSANHTHTITSQGGGLGHNNMQPWMAFNYIIKY